MTWRQYLTIHFLRYFISLQKYRTKARLLSGKGPRTDVQRCQRAGWGPGCGMQKRNLLPSHPDSERCVCVVFFFNFLFLSIETNTLWLLSLREDYTATWLVYWLFSVDWSCVALSSFQAMHGQSCLEENPTNCIVFSTEWQLATSLLLLADRNVASLLCHTPRCD